MDTKEIRVKRALKHEASIPLDSSNRLRVSAVIHHQRSLEGFARDDPNDPTGRCAFSTLPLLLRDVKLPSFLPFTGGGIAGGAVAPYKRLRRTPSPPGSVSHSGTRGIVLAELARPVVLGTEATSCAGTRRAPSSHIKSSSALWTRALALLTHVLHGAVTETAQSLPSSKLDLQNELRCR